jgi:hypothetical protein
MINIQLQMVGNQWDPKMDFYYYQLIIIMDVINII